MSAQFYVYVEKKCEPENTKHLRKKGASWTFNDIGDVHWYIGWQLIVIKLEKSYATKSPYRRPWRLTSYNSKGNRTSKDILLCQRMF